MRLHHCVVVDVDPCLRLVTAVLLTCNRGVGASWRISNGAGSRAVVPARLTWEELQSGSFPHQQLQLATGLEVEDCVAELDVSEAGAVALNDLVTRSQADFSGKATCLCRLDEDAGLLDRTLEVSNP